ncbi:nitrilase-related carbon-nitrogen hydrolase [Xinfangfangia sp. CPCC 101601]|uniref:Nitrilase-related carbon-nitrogen hydrolase n=1 Tax=Pseudogemmobacter lacusdianii TaxID=3069608 RepID=A0ABU0W0W3_9RHOB|nr:nitrilase-related carbon-nitrogen hydrolase [Xinfangfangia sp. CPCC 101601]MDQ2067657.1 nitrilase-related carbon-nitrogen hydrolase [Xinfangfangia sp. CPCC 101601]
MRLALWQGYSPAGDRDAALLQAEAALASAGALGAQALVMPETWLPGYNQDISPNNALSADDPVFTRLGRAAASADCALILGYAERDGDHIYNAAICLGPDGEPLAHYRKIQLFGPRERALYRAGDAYVTFPLGAETVALLICYDVEFSSHISSLRAKGVTAIFAPTANMTPFEHVSRATVPAMAANHGVSIVYANYCGSEGDLDYQGHSVIVGPHGEVLAQAGPTPALLIADLPARRPAYISSQNADLRVIE